MYDILLYDILILHYHRKSRPCICISKYLLFDSTFLFHCLYYTACFRCVLSVLGFLILVGTLYDLLVVQHGWQQINPCRPRELEINVDGAGDEPVLNFGAYTSLAELQEMAGPKTPEGTITLF